MSEIKSAEPFLRERLNNSPAYDYKFLAKLLDEYKNQFPPQEVTDEMIEHQASLECPIRAVGYRHIYWKKGFIACAKWMRSKLNK